MFAYVEWRKKCANESQNLYSNVESPFFDLINCQHENNERWVYRNFRITILSSNFYTSTHEIFSSE